MTTPANQSKRPGSPSLHCAQRIPERATTWVVDRSRASERSASEDSGLTSIAQLRQCRPFVHRYVIGLVALYLVLRLFIARMNGVAFERNFGSYDFDDPSADAPGFGVPAHVVAYFESTSGHDKAPSRFYGLRQGGLVHAGDAAKPDSE